MSPNPDLPEEKENATPETNKNAPSTTGEAKKPIIFQKNLKEKLEQEALKKAALTKDAEALSQFVLRTMAEKPKK